MTGHHRRNAASGVAGKSPDFNVVKEGTLPVHQLLFDDGRHLFAVLDIYA